MRRVDIITHNLCIAENVPRKMTESQKNLIMLVFSSDGKLRIIYILTDLLSTANAFLDRVNLTTSVLFRMLLLNCGWLLGLELSCLIKILILRNADRTWTWLDFEFISLKVLSGRRLRVNHKTHGRPLMQSQHPPKEDDRIRILHQNQTFYFIKFYRKTIVFNFCTNIWWYFKLNYHIIWCLEKNFNWIRSHMIHDMKTTDVSLNRPWKFIKQRFS